MMGALINGKLVGMETHMEKMAIHKPESKAWDTRFLHSLQKEAILPGLDF